MSFRKARATFWDRPGERRWLLRTVGAIFIVSVAWALLRFGATEVQTYYRFFLILLAPTLLAWWFLPLDSLRGPRLAPLTLSGAGLLAAAVFMPTLQARGYAIAAIGWMALFITLILANSSLKRTRVLGLTLVGIGVFESVYGLAQSVMGFDYIGGYFRNLGDIATGTLIHQNHFAGLLNMTIPFALGGLYARFAARTRSRLRASEIYAWSWIILLSCSLMGLSVLMSRSRAGAGILLAALLFAAVLLHFKARRQPFRILPRWSMAVLFVLVGGLSAWVGMDSLYEKVKNTGLSMDWRLSVYRDSLDLLGSNWLTGIGPRMYEWAFRPHQTFDADILIDFAHNDYLQSAIEWGLPLAILFWAFVVWRMVAAVRVFLVSQDPWRQGIALGCSLAIFTILLHSWVDFTLQIPANLAVFCVILGLSWAVEGQAAGEPNGFRERSPA